MKVKLTHTCNQKQGKGVTGDIVDVPESLAKEWIGEGGAVAVEDAKEKKPQEK